MFIKKTGLLVGMICLLWLFTVLTADCFVENSTTYTDNRGKQVNFPLGDISFADQAVSFIKGTPSLAEKYCKSDQALGPPDYVHDNQTPPSYVTIGCGGTLIVRFADNVLVDVSGPDLYVFEIGPDVEPTELSISKDGKNWIKIGKISGGTADVDISKHVKSGEVFQYVRLTDLKSACGGAYPGADIDAIGAIGSAVQITLDTSVLFDFNKYILKPEAQKELHKVANKIKEFPGSRVIIDGHTDSIGATEYNQKLSENRARAVRDHLLTNEKLKNIDININGYGESRPIATNDTEKGREKNRRVEIIILPNSKTQIQR
ncbi:MAG: OmpA family protein [Nitrospirae bacterium]|nr:OmpA family protein [Nitrospirota bacterium]